MGTTIIGILFCIIVVTLVGHGIWAFVAACFKAITAVSTESSPGIAQTGKTPHLSEKTRSQLEALGTTCRQLGRMVSEDRIDRDTYDLLRDELNRDFEKILNRALNRIDRLCDQQNIQPLYRDQWRQEFLHHVQEVALPPRIGHGKENISAAATPVSSEKWTTPPTSVARVETNATDPLTNDINDSSSTSATSVHPTNDMATKQALQAKISPNDGSDIVDTELADSKVPDQASIQQTPHPLDNHEEPIGATSPQRPLAEILSAFMLEKNIRWGELLSGMLIVGSVIGLVVSLREQLTDTIPYFANLLFLLGTAAVHGSGIYTLHKWKLHSTSRGVLTIGLLLVPLNFLAACLLAEPRGLIDPWFLIAIVIGSAGFFTMTYFSCRSLFDGQWWMPAIGVLGGSLVQPLINRIDGSTYDLPWYWMASITILGFVMSNGMMCRWIMANPDTPTRDSEWQIQTLGFSAFSFATAIGLLVMRSESIRSCMEQMSVLMSLFAAVVLVVGLLVHRRHSQEPANGLHMTGTSLTIVGVVLGVIAFVLAWPQPGLVSLVAVLNVIVLSTVALRGGLPPFLVGVAANLACLVVVLTHWLVGSFSEGQNLTSESMGLLFSSTSSLALTFAALLSGAAALSVPRLTKNRIDSQQHLLFVSSGGLACLSILAAVIAVFVNSPTDTTADIYIASGVLGFHALAALIAGGVWTDRTLLRIGEILLFISLLFFFLLALEIIDQSSAFLLGLLVHSSLCGFSAIFAWTFQRCREIGSERYQMIATELSGAGMITSGLALVVAVSLHHTDFFRLTLELLLISSVWLVGTVIHRQQTIFKTFQAATFATTVSVTGFVAVNGLQCQAWQEVIFWTAQLIGLSGVALGWGFLRLWWRGKNLLTQLLQPHGFSVDTCITHVLLTVVFVGSVVSVIPGITLELKDASSSASLSFDTFSQTMHAFGKSLWLPLGLLLVTILVNHATWYARRHLHGLLAIGVVASTLFVISADAQHATASALRWSLSLYGLLIAFLLWHSDMISNAWLQFRKWLRPAHFPYNTTPVTVSLTHTALGLTIIPILLLITVAAARGIQGLPFGGPFNESFFGRGSMLVEVNYGIPMALIVTALLSHAIGRRESKYALYGSIIMMYLVAAGLLLFTISSNPELLVRLVDIFQYAAIFAAAYGMIWLALHQHIQGQHATDPRKDGHLLSHIVIPGIMVVFLAFAAIVTVTLQPQESHGLSAAIGSWKGYSALIVTCFLYGLFFGRHLAEQVSWFSLWISVSILGTIVATVHGHTTPGWTAFHLLMLGCIGVASLTSLLPWGISRSTLVVSFNQPTQKWMSGVFTASVSAFGFLLACISNIHEPNKIWSLAAIAGLLILVNVLVYRFGILLAYCGQFLIIAGTIFLSSTNWIFSANQLIHIGLSLSAIYGILGIAVEITRNRSGGTRPPGHLPLHHRVATIVILSVVVLLVGLEFMAQFFGGQNFPISQGSFIENSSGWLTIVCAGILTTALLWDRESRLRLFPVFLWGGLAVTLVIISRFSGYSLWTCCCLGLTSYSAMGGWLWRNQFAISRFANSIAIQDAAETIQRSRRWFIPCQIILCFTLTIGQFLTLWQFEGRELRFAAALVPLASAISLAAISTVSQLRAIRTLAVILFSLFGVFCSWAGLTPGFESETWLERLVHLMIVGAFLTFLYSALIPRFFDVTTSWAVALRRGTLMSVGTTFVSLLVVLVVEMILFVDPGSSPADMQPFHIVTVAVALIAMVGGLLNAALHSDHDPLLLSPQSRQSYVYVAQVVTALLVLHIRMTWPDFFLIGFVKDYWHYLLLVVAFAGSALAEFFKRKKLDVLADPFANTGLVVSIAPVLLISLVSSAEQPGIILAVGLLHLIASVVRHSIPLLASAIVFGNLALWSFYATFEHWSLLNRPQFWLIPPAVSVLLAMHVHRHRLPHAQATLGRYLCIVTIYISSTSEIFIAGIGDQILPPIMLAILSVIGVFAGIALQIRVYLYLGTSFLFVSLLSMVMHAHQKFDHVWPWWAFGITMGSAILVMFGFFEKKRPELTAWIEKIRNWDG